MTAPIITWDPPIPQRPQDSKAQFNANATAFVASLPTLKVQINNANDWVNNQYAQIDALWIQKSGELVAAGDSYIQQISSSGDSYLSALNDIKTNVESLNSSAQLSANTAIGAANYKGEWSSLSGAISKPASVSHNGLLWLLINDLSNIELSEPSPSNPDWMQITQLSKRTVIITPASISSGGMYFIVGDGDVTISNQSQAGAVFDLVSSIASSPKIYGNITTRDFGDVDFVELDNQSIYHFIYNDITQKLEV